MRSVYAGAETLFRVHDIAPAGDDGATGWMELGAWSTGADGRTALSALCVLADDVLGYAIVAHPARPADRWSVSTEITVDEVDVLPEAGERVQAIARSRSGDEDGVTATGELRDADGRVFAVLGQRARFVPLSGMRDPQAEQEVFTPPASGGPARLLGLEADGPVDVLEVADILLNPGGTLHGGVSMATAAIAAERAVADGGPALRVLGVRTAFPRPAIAGDRLAVTTEVRHRGRTTGIVEVAIAGGGRLRTVSRVTLGA